MIKRGFVLTNAMIQAEQDEALFNEALDYLTQYKLEFIEFYTDEIRAERYGKAIKDRGYEPLFLTALDQKRNADCRICSEDESQRVRSVDFTKRSIEKAISSGAKRTLFMSGAYPNDYLKEVICMNAVEKSMRELSEFAGSDIKLMLEPCDRSVDICQLLGPSMQVFTLMKKLSLPNIGLTMDVSHITELFEDPIEAIRLCKPYCDHIHIANCAMDPESELFGDKHPLFGIDKGCYSEDDSYRMYQEIIALYSNDNLYISLEMISHGALPMPFLTSVIDNVPWFFKG